MVSGFGLVGLETLVSRLDKLVPAVLFHDPAHFLDAHQTLVVVAEEDVLERRVSYKIFKNP